MKIKLLAVGAKMPAWVESGFTEYAKRLPREIKLDLIEIALGSRGKNADLNRAIKQESDRILAHINSDDHVIALEVKGAAWSTEHLAKNIKLWQMEGLSLVLMVGGPDGLSGECLKRANQQWSLSPLTLPHPIVRVLLSEQIYRAWSFTQNHPYHRS